MATIKSIVTLNKDKCIGDTSIFFATDEEELAGLSKRLEKILDATAHELLPGTILLVDHRE